MDINEILDNELKQKTYQVPYLEYHINNFIGYQYKNTTKENYKHPLNKFNQYIINSPITELREDNINQTVKQYRNYLDNGTNLKTSSIDNYITILRVFLNQHLNLETTKIKKLNTGNDLEPKYINLKDIKGLVNTVQYITGNTELVTRDKAIICTLFGAGLRISELMNIEKKDYIKENGIYYLYIHGKGTAKGSKKPIAIPNETAKHINEYLEERNKHNRSCKYLFCSYTDKQLTRQAVNKNIKKYAKEYDKRNNENISSRVSTHTFRHSLARYLLVDKGVPISQVKDILRHSNIETTAKYLTNSQEEIQQLRQNIF